ncbi:hypothetical protein GIB67_006861 [Kingdonia uniflora]|uniref:Uncharacterized protein n=1 Tax=Kingdonia uniflora TaxID=39325 RepID=A0A7J7L041_9MAGN|nr:hypothetical protein GIB67_006861 [Kingdonia uniflora]
MRRSVLDLFAPLTESDCDETWRAAILGYREQIHSDRTQNARVLSPSNVTSALHIGHGLTAAIQVTCLNMMEFFDSLGVKMKMTDMSVAVSLDNGRSCEWGTRNGLSSLFEQKKNLLNPYFYQMIRQILKFKDEVIKFVEDLENNPDHNHSNETLEHFVKSDGYSELF